MWFIADFEDWRLDIVGIVAILGEGSTSRNAQASAHGWHHILPRLLPAPQALIRHQQVKRLPTQSGTVVGAYSGNVRFELNFFSQLLHERELENFEVEVVIVKKRKQPCQRCIDNRRACRYAENSLVCQNCSKKEECVPKNVPAFGVIEVGYLAYLSALGCLMATALFALSIHYKDGFALLATLLLSFTSTAVGLASWWNLDFPEEHPKRNREDEIPAGDVVIFYPRQGAFRIIRCDEQVSRLYFKAERCVNKFSDNYYRVAGLLTTVLLMGGLLCLANARSILQMAFAASYILLNILHWASSALNPLVHHWQHNYCVEPKPIYDASGSKPSPAAGGTQTPQAPAVAPAIVVSSPEAIGMTPRASLERTSGDGVTVIGPVGPGRCSNEFPLSATGYVTNILRDPNSKGAKVQWPPAEVKELDVEAGLKPKTSLIRRASMAKFIPKKSRTNTGSHFKIEIPKDVQTFTSALWTAIALTGTARWVKGTNIAPNNDVWDQWVSEAGKRAAPKRNTQGLFVTSWTEDEEGRYSLPVWEYQARLSQLFKEERERIARRPDWVTPVRQWIEQPRGSPSPVIQHKLQSWLHRARLRIEQGTSLDRPEGRPVHNVPTLVPPAPPVRSRNTHVRDFGV